VPEICRAKNTSIKLPSSIKLAFHFISSCELFINSINRRKKPPVEIQTNRDEVCTQNIFSPGACIEHGSESFRIHGQPQQQGLCQGSHVLCRYSTANCNNKQKCIVIMLYGELKVTCTYNARKRNILNGIHIHVQQTAPLCT